MSWPRTAIEARMLLDLPVTCREITDAHNEEYRRALIERYGGLDRLIIDHGREIDRDDSGTLIELATAGEPIRAVAVTCPTTGRRYVLRVPPAITSAHAGVAWTFGLTAGQYHPSSQS